MHFHGRLWQSIYQDVLLSGCCENLSAEVRMFLTVGFCGGFTTFSTFASESLLLLKAGEWLNFSLYTVISVTCGIALTALGSFIALSVRNG